MAHDTRPILDPCCGSRMFYFDKEDPRVLFCDNREVEETLCDGRTLRIRPDILTDFRDLPFGDESFDLVIFDPPHLKKAGESSWLAKKYGTLPRKGWEEYLRQGFSECWRVLRPGCTMVFKWNEEQIRLSRILPLLPGKPVMGTPRGKTIFLVLYKPKKDME